MIYVALAEAAALVVLVISFTGIVRSQIRQQARERELLVNQLCHLAGRPWQEAPAWEPEPDFSEVGNVWAIPPEQMEA